MTVSANDLYLKIYCVTVPGTTRHITMREQLRRLNAPHEFCYGEVLEDAPIYRIRHASALGKIIHGDKSGIRIAINSFACKMAMMRAMRKFAAAHDTWGLIIQDDVVVPENWKELCIKSIADAPEGTGSIAVCTRPGRKKHEGWASPWNCVNYTEPAAIVSRQYAIDNAAAMEDGGSLSDFSYYKKYNRFGVVYHPEPFIEYTGIESYIKQLSK